MKIAIVASLLIAGASAFVPAAKTTSSTTVLNAANQFTSKYSNELGVISPTGFFGELNAFYFTFLVAVAVAVLQWQLQLQLQWWL